MSYVSIDELRNWTEMKRMLQHEQPRTQSIVRLVSQIQSEEIQQLHQRRELNRQKISLAVSIVSLKDDERFEAISRDLSPQAIGLITTQPVEPDQLCELQIHHSTETNPILAKCVWCEPLGPAYYSSAWDFDTEDAAQPSDTFSPLGYSPF